MAAQAPRYGDWLDASQVESLGRDLHDPAPLREIRAESFRSFLELPLEPDPLYRKYGYFAGVDLTGLVPEMRGSPLQVPAASSSSVLVVHDAAGTHAVVPPELREQGVRLETYPEVLQQDGLSVADFLRGTSKPSDRLTALGVALVNRGYRLELPDGLAAPVRLKDVTLVSREHEALSVRRSIRLGRQTRLLASEEVYSTMPAPAAQRLYGSSTDLDVGPNAHAAYLSAHAPDTQTVSIYTRHATVGDGARLGWVWAGFGGFRTRMRNTTLLPGNGADVEDLQSFYGAGHQGYDSSVHITHIGTDTHGQSITRGVFRDEARGMSRGLVRIEKDARRTLSYLSEHAMLLSRGARSDTIPILEILCRDVKATHSTSVAPVDPERVFYLESRGMPEEAAVRMIGEGFLAHVLERAPIENLRELLYPYLHARWEGRTVTWDGGQDVGLPALEFRGGEATTDWRFDSKLR
jgi:Fe-S cluster assembly scaffold protein SufB